MDGEVARYGALPGGEVFVHDVLMDEATAYGKGEKVLAGRFGLARNVGLWLADDAKAVVVDRLPGRAAYPRSRGHTRLFTLGRGQVGCWRANFRFIGSESDPSWFFEDWLVHVGHTVADPGRFVAGRPDYEVDDRVHLYGGATPAARRR